MKNRVIDCCQKKRPNGRFFFLILNQITESIINGISENPNPEFQLMVEKTNHILVSNGVERIQENEDFIKDEFSHENYVVYTIQKNENECIKLRLEFSTAGVDIGINEFYEVHSLDYEEIANGSHWYENI